MVENSPSVEGASLCWRSVVVLLKKKSNWAIITWGEATGEDEEGCVMVL